MQTFRDLSIKRKLTLSGVATSVVVLVLASIVFAVHEYMAFRDDTVAHLESTAFIVGSNCTVTLTFEDPEIAAELLSALEKQPYIAAAAVYDATGTLFARYLRADTSPALVPASPRADDYYIEDDGLMVFKPIIYEDERLGTIFLRSDTEALNAELRDIGLLILLVLAVSSLLAYLLSVRLQAFVSEPVAQLAHTARVITSQHDYTLRAKSVGRDEVGRLVEAFNQMLEELQREMAERQQAEDALRQSKEALEEAHHRLQEHQTLMLQSEKMASIGQLAAGIAHELNNPIAFIFSNFSTLEEYVQDLSALLASYRTLEEHSKQGDDAQIAATRAQIAQQQDDLDLDFLLTDIDALIRESRSGAERARDIVRDLKEFSHVDKDRQTRSNLNANLKSTLHVVHGDLAQKAELITEFGEIPDILCYPRELNQALMGILLNAAQAIDGRGKITIRSYQDNGYVCIDIADNGNGMPPEIQKRIFEPFFTTKDVGSGTGMGLSMAYNAIVTLHDGQLLVDSTEGVGTTFTAKLPV